MSYRRVTGASSGFDCEINSAKVLANQCENFKNRKESTLRTLNARNPSEETLNCSFSYV